MTSENLFELSHHRNSKRRDGRSTMNAARFLPLVLCAVCFLSNPKWSHAEDPAVPSPKTLAAWQQAQIVFQGKLDRVQAGPVGRSFPPMGSLKTTASISTSLRIRSVKRAANSPWICIRLRTTSGWSISNTIASLNDRQLRTPMLLKNPPCTYSISTWSLDCQARVRLGHLLGNLFLSKGFKRR